MRRLLVESLVRALLVVLVAERLEVPLLGGTAPTHGLDRLPFQGAMPALVRLVVLRAARATPLVENP